MSLLPNGGQGIGSASVGMRSQGWTNSNIGPCQSNLEMSAFSQPNMGEIPPWKHRQLDYKSFVGAAREPPVAFPGDSRIAPTKLDDGLILCGRAVRAPRGFVPFG